MTSARSKGAAQSWCSFCRAELVEAVVLTIPGSRGRGQRSTTGWFCSARCGDCVLALAALNPSPLASREFIAKRTLLTDRLLELWRRGSGPEPSLVLEAARQAGSGLAISP